MPRDLSGTYTLPVSAFVSSSVIISGDVNSDLSDIGIALTQSLATTGVSTMTAPIKLASGTVTAPGLSFNANTGTGFYLAAANSLGIAINSVSVARINSSATMIWGFDNIFGSVVSFASVAGLTGGIKTTTTITGMLDITGGLIVGYDGVPAVDTIKIGTSVLGFDFDSGIRPRVNFNINSTLFYDRASNFWLFSVSSSIAKVLNTTNLFYSGRLNLTEGAAPASAPTNEAIIYVRDNGNGLSRMYYKNDQGAETAMGGPGYWEVISTFTVTTSVASIQVNLSKLYSRLIMVGTSVSPAGTATENAFIVQSSGDNFANQPDGDGSLVGAIHGTPANAQTLILATQAIPSGNWSSGNNCSFYVEYSNCNNTGFKNVIGYAYSSAEDTTQVLVGVNSSAGYARINSLRAIFVFFNILAGRITLYGELAE